MFQQREAEAKTMSLKEVKHREVKNDKLPKLFSQCIQVIGNLCVQICMNS